MNIKKEIKKIKKLFNKLGIVILLKVEGNILVKFIKDDKIIFIIIIDEYSDKVEYYTNTNKYSLWFLGNNIKIGKLELFAMKVLKVFLKNIEKFSYDEFKKSIIKKQEKNIEKKIEKKKTININKLIKNISYNNRKKYSKISIIIPTYNATNKIKKILYNFKNIEYNKNDFEIIIVNDGGTNHKDLQKILKKYNKKINIKLFKQDNLGFRAGQARNLGAKNAKYDILLFIDQDSIPHKKILLSHHLEHKDNDIVLGSINGLKIVGNSKFYKKRKNTLENNILGDFRSNINDIDVWKIFISWHFSIKKDIFLKNNFDNNFIGRGEEDIELGYRLAKKGYQIHFSNIAIIFPQIESDKDRKQVIQLKKFKTWLKNTFYFYNKYKDDKKLGEYLISKFTINYYTSKHNYNLEIEKFKKIINKAK